MRFFELKTEAALFVAAERSVATYVSSMINC
jgi:hypothetical protein